MFSKFTKFVTETYGKYITLIWHKIEPNDFPDTRVEYFDKIIKLSK